MREDGWENLCTVMRGQILPKPLSLLLAVWCVKSMKQKGTKLAGSRLPGGRVCCGKQEGLSESSILRPRPLLLLCCETLGNMVFTSNQEGGIFFSREPDELKKTGSQNDPVKSPHSAACR